MQLTNNRSRDNRRAFTLLEVLIATTVTLLLMAGLAQVFKVLGNSITQGRAGLELNNRLRNVIHRIRTDLDNVTVDPKPPVKVGAGQGYLKYFDGPGTDYSPMAFNPADLSQLFPNTPNTLLNRFGDLDDILLATVKARDSWFTGRVPRFLLDPSVPLNTNDANSNGILDVLEDLVTISSQYAEVAIFAEPLPTTNRLASPDPTADNLGRDPIRLAADPTGGYEDSFLGGDTFPDGFKLHYRVLLIRPDLNLASGVLRGLGHNTDPTQRALVAGPEWLTPEFQVQPPPNPVPPGYAPLVPYASSGNRIRLPSPMCDMWRIHQFCDLSVRRVFNAADGLGGTQDFVAANSLEDLANPINRFAHYTEPLGAGYTSMPILALSQPLPYQTACLNTAGVAPRNNFYFSAGFLHPAFTLLGRRAGEDVLTNDLLAFDIKAFDSSAPIIARIDSPDGLVLRPGDPGFVSLGLSQLSGNPAVAVTQATGEFVDLNWAGKAGTTWTSEFSCGLATSPTTIPLALKKSGLVKFDTDNRTVCVFQPSYDTFSDLYERDGVYQAQLFGKGTAVSLSGAVSVVDDASIPVAAPNSWTRTLIDSGKDGIDNDGDGTADDLDERETSPPFVTNLRGLQISVRLEDKPTKQFKQMSTIKEFVTR